MQLIRRLTCLLAAGLVLSAASGSAEAQQRDTLRLAIEDAVTRVLRESDEVRIAGAQIELTDAQITTARATGLPQARLSSSYSQVLRNARAQIVGQSIFGQNYNYTGNINISQILFQGGRVFAGMRAAGDARNAARYNRAETEAQLSVDVQRAYFTAQLARELLQIQERNMDLAADRLVLVQQLESGGRASRYDVLRARVERSNLEPALLQARSAVELADIELRRVLNIPSDQPFALTSALDSGALREVTRLVTADSSSDPVRASERAALSAVDGRREACRWRGPT
jgi:outer membrane protein TolC